MKRLIYLIKWLPFALVVLMVLHCLLLLCGIHSNFLAHNGVSPLLYVVMHDTVAKNIWRIDTTIVKDSVYFAVKGDTIFKERYNTKWRIKVAHDTINKVVEKPVEVLRTSIKTETKEVNRLYWWQKVLILLGCASLIYLIVQIYKFGKRK